MPNRDAERDLILRCVRGDADAWRDFIRQYGALVAHAVRTTFGRMAGTSDANEIDEAMQSIWVSLTEDGCRRLRSFGGRCALSTWLTVLSTRRTLDHIRREKRRVSLNDIPLEILPHAKEGGYLNEDERSRLHQALSRLPEDQRLILTLYYFDGLSYQSIAEIMHLASNTISPYLLRAREQLKQRLSEK